MNTVSENDIKEVLIERHGKEGYEALKKAHIAIAGLGGLGSNIAISLARAGVGHIHVIDFDKVDLSNIQRQQYTLADIGKYKADVISKKIKEINPYIEVKAENIKVTEENISDLFKDDLYICEAFDKAEYKALLVNEILEKFPEKYIIAASGMAGVDDGNLIKTKKITDKFFICGDMKSALETHKTLFAPRVAICANHQALKLIRLILGKEGE